MGEGAEGGSAFGICRGCDSVVADDLVEVEVIGLGCAEGGMVDYVRHADAVTLIRADGDMARLEDDDVARLELLCV